jgi:hypothetical protein
MDKSVKQIQNAYKQVIEKHRKEQLEINILLNHIKNGGGIRI